MRIDIETMALTVTSGALGIVAALTLSAPAAFADPAVVPPPPAPAPAPALGPAPGPAPGTTVHAAGSDPVAPPPAPDSTVQAAGPDGVTPPNGMPHLSSLQNLPPGTTTAPPDDNQPGGLGYLRDLWNAVQTQNVSGRDALLLLAQRPLDADAVPPPGLPANPTPPQPGPPAPSP